MRRWAWTIVAALIGAALALALQLGGRLWRASVQLGFIGAPRCPGGPTTTGDGFAIPMCAWPASLIVVTVATVLAAALLAGLAAYRIAEGSYLRAFFMGRPTSGDRGPTG